MHLLEDQCVKKLTVQGSLISTSRGAHGSREWQGKETRRHLLFGKGGVGSNGGRILLGSSATHDTSVGHRRRGSSVSSDWSSLQTSLMFAGLSWRDILRTIEAGIEATVVGQGWFNDRRHHRVRHGRYQVQGDYHSNLPTQARKAGRLAGHWCAPMVDLLRLLLTYRGQLQRIVQTWTPP